MSHKVIQGALASAVADAGTFDVAYPSRDLPEVGKYNEGDFHLGVQHKLVMNGKELKFPENFGVTIDGTDITITNKTGATWPADSDWYLEMQRPGKAAYRDGVTGARINRVGRSDVFVINLGAPDAIDDNGIAEAQNLAAAGDLTLNGALVSDGVAVLDVPRNVIVDSGGADTAVLTVYGTDEYGVAMRESITLNGTTAVSGKKAFKTITRIAASAAISNGAFVGTGDVLGLPVFLPNVACVFREIADAAAATAGTLVAGDVAAGASTATTADVRGTYDPNSACNGEINFTLFAVLPDPGYLGKPQFNG